MRAFDDLAQANGFENGAELSRMVNSVDLSSPKKIQAFTAWKLGDGSKEGLLKLVGKKKLRQTTLFCEKRKGIYEHFFGCRQAVGMCGVEPADIISVTVIEEHKKSTHFGWWDNKDKKFCMIFRSKLQVEVCFPYGYKVCEEKGEGQLCGLRVKEGRLKKI